MKEAFIRQQQQQQHYGCKQLTSVGFHEIPSKTLHTNQCVHLTNPRQAKCWFYWKPVLILKPEYITHH